MQSNSRFDYIENLPRQTRSELGCEEWRSIRKPRRPYIPVIRPSHLKARRYWLTHPFLRIAKVYRTKLPTMAELEKLTHEELAARFLKHCAKFKYRRHQ